MLKKALQGFYLTIRQWYGLFRRFFHEFPIAFFYQDHLSCRASPGKASRGLVGRINQGEDRDGHDDHRNNWRQNESRGKGDHERTCDIDETQEHQEYAAPPPLPVFRSWMAEALRETLPERDHRCREGIGD